MLIHVALNMETSFKAKLTKIGITDDSLVVMEEESVNNEAIFKALRRPHIYKLLDVMKVGQHALLLDAWEGQENRSSLESSGSSFLISEAVKSPSPVTIHHATSNADSSANQMSRPLRLSLNSKPIRKGHLKRARSADSSPSPVGSPLIRSMSPQASVNTDSLPLTSSKSSIQELAKAYKKSALDRYQATSSSSSKSLKLKRSMMMITLGGMLYDCDLKKGIRKKSLPEPNPTKVEVESNSSLLEVQKRAKELYFEEYSTPPEMLLMGDSSGVPILITDTTLKETELQDAQNNDDAKDDKEYNDGYTTAVVEKCIRCGRPFRTYVPDSKCMLPDGGIVTYQEPQLECPDCDFNLFGLFMNEDLFPHLCVRNTVDVEVVTELA